MKTRVLFGLMGLVVVSTFLAGCVSTQPTAKVDATAGAAPLAPYNGPKVSIAVADFEVKAAKAGGDIGSGLRDMLTTALVQSNRFKVLERQALAAVQQEQELAASGAADKTTGPKKGKIKTADIIVTAAVTEFEPQASGIKAGGGAGAGIGGAIVGGILGAAKNKAHMAMDIRIIDATTSEVLTATRVEGEAKDVAGGFGAGFFGGGVLMGAGLSAYANTPMEKAIRVCINEAVRYLSETTPKEYFKY
ncbi:MAG TPA: CsgG/HfaB family protein [candidate division Zixibacteria bacterium]